MIRSSSSLIEYLTVPAPSLTQDAFTDDESLALAPYFTNTDRPVFALTHLPETVKGALFARYSRSAKSLTPGRAALARSVPIACTRVC